MTLKLDMGKGEISLIIDGKDQGVGYSGLELNNGKYRLMVAMACTAIEVLNDDIKIEHVKS